MSDFSQLIENIDPSQFDELFMPAYKRQRYGGFRRSQAARRIQSSYRRYRGAGSSDQRQLRSVVRSHRKANPYQIVPSSGRTVSFWRKTEMSILINQLNGFGPGGNNLNFGFSLGRVFGFLNGSLTYAPVTSDFSDWQALFDYYRLNAVKMQIYFSKTNNDQSAGATIGMPMLLICNDFDDIGETMTLSTMNQRIGVRHVQFDANNSKGITHYIKPKPTTVVVQTDISTGVQSASNSGVTMGTQWLDTAQNNIVHNGVKVFYNNQGLTTNTNIGNITFVWDVEYVFKGYR